MPAVEVLSLIFLIFRLEIFKYQTSWPKIKYNGRICLFGLDRFWKWIVIHFVTAGQVIAWSWYDIFLKGICRLNIFHIKCDIFKWYLWIFNVIFTGLTLLCLSQWKPGDSCFKLMRFCTSSSALVSQTTMLSKVIISTDVILVKLVRDNDINYSPSQDPNIDEICQTKMKHLIPTIIIIIISRSRWNLSDNNDMITGSTPWGRELYRDLI